MTEELKTFLASGREFFASGKRYDVPERREMLRDLLAAVKKNRDYITSALHEDLHRSECEALSSEYIPCCEALKYLIRRVARFAAPRRAALSVFNWPGCGRVIPEPFGMTLIFNAWNYPFLLAIDPLAGALAAGNRVVLDLSSQSPASARVIAQIVRDFGHDDAVAVIVADGGDEELRELLREKFDFIFFTGGRKTALDVARAAAENFTPAVLELGGKSPVIVDGDADLKVAARRIAWGKFLNAGQTCVAPDYVLVHRRVKDEFIHLLRKAVHDFYGDDPMQSENYGRIVNSRHYERLVKLLDDGRLICGGEKDPEERYIAPTVIDQVDFSSPVMAEEIFGPLLPVIEVSGVEDAAALINRRPKPLALYYFGSSRAAKKKILSLTSSGGAAVNDTVMHLINPELPFGGVGASGMGRYHGKYSFDTFSHLKGCMFKTAFPDFRLRYPPYAKWLVKLLKKIF